VKRLLGNSLRILVYALLFVVCASALSIARDTSHEREFKGVVQAIEDHYGVRHTHIPFVGLLVSVAAHPAGVSNFKLAVFEDFHSANITTTSASVTDDLQGVVEHSLGSDWRLFVRTRSHNDDDNTLIYVNLGDGKLRMMIVTIEPNEATVVEMNLSERAMLNWIEKESVEEHSWHHHHRAED